MGIKDKIVCYRSGEGRGGGYHGIAWRFGARDICNKTQACSGRCVYSRQISCRQSKGVSSTRVSTVGWFVSVWLHSRMTVTTWDPIAQPTLIVGLLFSLKASA